MNKFSKTPGRQYGIPGDDDQGEVIIRDATSPKRQFMKVAEPEAESPPQLPIADPPERAGRNGHAAAKSQDVIKEFSNTAFINKNILKPKTKADTAAQAASPLNQLAPTTDPAAIAHDSKEHPGSASDEDRPESMGLRQFSQGNRGVYLNSLKDQRNKERNDKIEFYEKNKEVMLPLEREVIKGEINLL